MTIKRTHTKPFSILQRLHQKPAMIADGAMGTELYRRGVLPRDSFEGENIANPARVQKIHEAYAAAGAELIESNTFGANRDKLKPFGLEGQLESINRQGMKLARLAAGEDRFIAAPVGPSGRVRECNQLLTAEENHHLRDLFLEHLRPLLAEAPDVLAFESFTSLQELQVAFDAARALSAVPILVQIRLHHSGKDFLGLQPLDYLKTVEGWGADIIGANCTDPDTLLKIMELFRANTTRPISAMPNAGIPRPHGDRLLFTGTAQTMATWARRYARAGVNLIGGCCGTTPEMIEQMSGYVRGMDGQAKTGVLLEALANIEVKAASKMTAEKPPAEKSKLGQMLYGAKDFVISVEIDSPRGIDTGKEIEGIRLLANHGAHFINIADNPRAIPRMSAEAFAQIVRAQTGMEPIVHVCGRDRNWFRLQSDMIGYDALGLRNLIIITGDPPKNTDDGLKITPVFDLDSIGIIRLGRMLNRGIDGAGDSIGGQTQLFLATGCDPGALDQERELSRLKRKIDAGAEAVFSQPVYDASLLQTYLAKTQDFLTIPLMVGIYPLKSLANAEFLHNHVPGMRIPEWVLSRLRATSDRAQQAQVGIEIARESLAGIKALAKNFPWIRGAYLMPAFNDARNALPILKES